MVIIRPVLPAEAEAWLAMRLDLWPEEPPEGHAREIEDFLLGRLTNPLHVLIAIVDSAVVGFAELFIRPYAEGCLTDRVAYLEGWYVRPEARRQGVGRALVEAAEAWGRSQGCTEFASDTLVDNGVSAKAHAALGFGEVEVIRCFRKSL